MTAPCVLGTGEGYSRRSEEGLSRGDGVKLSFSGSGPVPSSPPLTSLHGPPQFSKAASDPVPAFPLRCVYVLSGREGAPPSLPFGLSCVKLPD